MALSGERLFNDFIIFLTMCPGGLCLYEVELLFEVLPTQMTEAEKSKKIKLYIDMLNCEAKGIT